MTELALQERPKRGARFGSTDAGLRAKGLAGVNQRGEEWPINGPEATMAATNKYLARNNKSLERIKATKKQNRQ